MTTRTRARIYVSIAAMILTAGLAVPAAAQTSCPAFVSGNFRGTFQGQDAHPIGSPQDTLVVIHTTATGVASHLGRFSLVRDVTGSLVDFSHTGAAEWVAANGDSIYTTVAGQAGPSELPGGFLRVVECHVITGGTGRFTGAHGRFIVELFHKFEVSSVEDGVESHDIFGSFQGTISKGR